MADPCQIEFQEAYICLQVFGPAECSCFDFSTFTTDFALKTRASFLSTQAFVGTTSPSFCDVANKRICDYYQVNQACCCDYETEQYRKCLVEQVLVKELSTPPAEPCVHTCPAESNEGESSSTVIITIIVVVIALLLLIVVGFLYWRHRKSRNGKAETVKIPDRVCVENDVESAKRDSDLTTSDSEGETDKTVVKAKADESIELKTTRPKPKRVPSKALVEECNEDEDEVRRSRADQLKKKRQAIETWNKEKKHGSKRGLESYWSDDNLLDGGKANAATRKKESQSRQQSSSKRRSKSARELGKLAKSDGSERDVKRSGSDRSLKETADPANVAKYKLEVDLLKLQKKASLRKTRELEKDSVRVAQLNETVSDLNGQAAEIESETPPRKQLELENLTAPLETPTDLLSGKLEKSSASRKLPEEERGHTQSRPKRAFARRKRKDEGEKSRTTIDTTCSEEVSCQESLGKTSSMSSSTSSKSKPDSGLNVDDVGTSRNDYSPRSLVMCEE